MKHWAQLMKEIWSLWKWLYEWMLGIFRNLILFLKTYVYFLVSELVNKQTEMVIEKEGWSWTSDGDWWCVSHAQWMSCVGNSEVQYNGILSIPPYKQMSGYRMYKDLLMIFVLMNLKNIIVKESRAGWINQCVNEEDEVKHCLLLKYVLRKMDFNLNWNG